ncbi:polyketide cyclase [Dulcicalothrix desertica PCC 7102]|uniref:Polyketide cyclase n=1 Tax=Dulcicalothrix desertica PCC 7102 TaxID=232991 RepID=A0A3S1ARQ9_9CYAN|nr:SRPBCC family protein [Dulcicalothrix desertica]RUT07777.1 polyketide cyclase [Dulcicalothrix desertica PCC 7102]TWH39302.1 polyketide cyclase/dehydrase/lipid transport protein [Dulcicalothrix desertica PCC 7102]
MSETQVIENSILINASATTVERCITELNLMHRWLNPVLRCYPAGDWNTNVGGKSKFVIEIPLIKPTLNSTIVERQPGLVVWGFEGFFKGKDRWECQPTPNGTCLLNRFEFQIPNPIVTWGFKIFAEKFTKQDMQAQLGRLKRVAEEVGAKT